MTGARVLTAAALATGLAVAVLLGLFHLIGDCWAGNDTPDAIRACEVDKRNGMFAFMGLAGGMWLAGAVRATRGRPFAKRLALLSGPVALIAANAIF